jgi:hypothetical protein
MSALAVGAFLCLPLAQLHSDVTDSDSLETAFVDGGRITITLSAGEHRITESPDDHIRVHWRVKDQRSSRDVDARTDVDGTTAKIEVDGPRKGFHTVIEVPRHSDLTVRLSAGELKVGNIEGNKDIHLRAGDLSIEVGNTQDYAQVEGSLWAGDIDAGPFKMQASGLFRSIAWKGEGEHQLRFKLYAGDVRLHQGKKEG